MGQERHESQEIQETRAQSVERRKYYRIDDVVMLRYEMVDEGAVAQPPSTDDNSELLESIDRELNPVINAIWREHPPVAQALGLINRKLSILAAAITDDSDSEPSLYRETRVNLSGCGIGFEAPEELAVGTRLQLTITLAPSQVTVTIGGTVIGSEARVGDGEMPFRVRVDFDDDLQVQEQLIQHVVQKQAALLAGDSDDGPPRA